MSAFDKIVPQLWMMVSPAERLVIAASFHLTKSGIVEIHDQDVITDGYKTEDLERIGIGTMAAFVGEPTDTDLSFSRLWELTVSKARSIVHPPEAMSDEAPINLANMTEVSNEEMAAIKAGEIPGTTAVSAPTTEEEEVKEEVILPEANETPHAKSKDTKAK